MTNHLQNGFSFKKMTNQKQRLDQTGIGVHAIIELYDCPYALLNDENYIRNAICRAVRAAGTRLLELTSHHFSPQGVTALGLLAESHISIHTWPEAGYAAADLFTCGRQSMSVAVTQVLIGLFRAGRHNARYLTRGEGLCCPAAKTDPHDRDQWMARVI